MEEKNENTPSTPADDKIVLPKPHPIRRVKALYTRHERKILLTGLTVTTTVAGVLGRANKLHNDFLEEKGLLDEYYDMSTDVPALPAASSED